MTTMITVEDRPEQLQAYRKTALTYLQWITEPVTVKTMEGTTYEINETNEHWDDGYYVAWPDDGTDPYPVAPSFVRENYELASDEKTDPQSFLHDIVAGIPDPAETPG